MRAVNAAAGEEAKNRQRAKREGFRHTGGEKEAARADVRRKVNAGAAKERGIGQSGRERVQGRPAVGSQAWRREQVAQIAHAIGQRMLNLYLPNPETGRRPCYGDTDKFQSDPFWREYLLFFEHFHGDNGAGLGAMHQTGWTGLIANLVDEKYRT